MAQPDLDLSSKNRDGQKFFQKYVFYPCQKIRIFGFIHSIHYFTRAMKKNTIPALAILMATSMFFMQGCRDILVIEYVQCPVCQPDGSSDDQENQGGSGLGNNLVSFHASVESLNLATKSMSPIAADTRVMIYAYHGSTDDAVSTSAVARGSYTAKQTGTLTGDSGYKMLLTNGIFDFYAVSTNTSDSPPVFSNGISSALKNGVDYLWWNEDNYDVAGSQVTVPVVLNHSATQISIELDTYGEGVYVQSIVSAAVTVPKPGAQMDLSTGVIPPATEYDAAPAAMGINGLKLQYTMLPLKTDQPMKLTLNLMLNGEPDVKKYEVDIPVPNGELAAGNSYKFRAVIDGDNVTFPQVGVSDWVDVDETGNPLYPH